MKTECLLIHPPVWEAAAPYLAGPALVGFLRSQGFAAALYDANIDFWHHFKAPQKAETVFSNCLRDIHDATVPLEEAVAAHSAVAMGQHEFLDWMAAVSIGSPAYELLVRGFGGFAARQSGNDVGTLRYHDRHFSDISHSFAATDSRRLFEHVVADDANVWRVYARERFMPRVAASVPSVLGFTIAAVNQVVPAIAMAVEARKEWPHLHIVFGGAWVTHLRKQLQVVPWLEETRFHFVPYQGETFLAELCQAVRTYRDAEAICRNAARTDSTTRHIPIRLLPTPDYSDLDLQAYAEPGHLPLMASKGCYWARCKFCSYPLLEPKYETRAYESLVRDVDTLATRYNAHHIPFTDPSMSAPVARAVSKVLMPYGRSITWGTFLRFDKTFSRDTLAQMAESGCSVLFWGLETGSERLQEELAKGIRFDTVERVLRDAANAGIHNRILMMYGFPGETAAELDSSVDLIASLYNYIGSACWSRCTVEIDTPLSGRSNLSSPRSTLDLSLGEPGTPSCSPSVLALSEKRMANISASLTNRSRPHFPTTVRTNTTNVSLITTAPARATGGDN